MYHTWSEDIEITDSTQKSISAPLKPAFGYF